MTRPAILAITLIALAGAGGFACSSDGSDSDANAGSGGEQAAAGTQGTAGNAGNGASAGSGGSAAFGGSGGSGGSVGEQPYAHVVAVSTSGSDQDYDFSVSVESADIDCTQFANWWEVLSEDGALLYRRILEHSHTDENGTADADMPGNTFTRSGGPVPIAADTVVLVRAHMSTGGYNGRVMRGSPSAGFADAPDITSTFAAGVEADPPQSVSCDF